MGLFSSIYDSLFQERYPLEPKHPRRVLRNEAKDDCLSCRVMGSTAFVLLGGYTYFSGMNNLKAQQSAIMKSKSKYKYGSRQLGIVTISATLVGLGIWRMVGDVDFS